MMKEKTMIFITVKLVIAVLLTFIAIGLYITGADTESSIAYSFLFNVFVVADIIYEIAKCKRRKRKMPRIIINNNGLNLEEIERMQNEKDENSIQEKNVPEEPENREKVISVSESVQKEIKRRFESGD